MSTAPGRRVAHPELPQRLRPTTEGPAPGDAARHRAERRRRERHFRRRRRDLLEDAGMALAVMVALLSMTAGLGIVALIEVPLITVVVGSLFAERVVARRRSGARERPRRMPPRAPAAR